MCVCINHCNTLWQTYLISCSVICAVLYNMNLLQQLFCARTLYSTEKRFFQGTKVTLTLLIDAQPGTSHEWILGRIRKISNKLKHICLFIASELYGNNDMWSAQRHLLHNGLESQLFTFSFNWNDYVNLAARPLECTCHTQNVYNSKAVNCWLRSSSVLSCKVRSWNLWQWLILIYTAMPTEEPKKHCHPRA